MAQEPINESTAPLPAPRPPADAEPTEAPEPAEPAEPAEPTEPAGEPRWSTPSLLILSVALVGVLVAAAYHLGTVFLAIAPSNPVSQPHSTLINDHVLPEFEQNWQLFAPNPLQDNIAVEARVQTIDPDGNRAQSPWIDLTGQDVAVIRGNPAPSHVDQNLLRRAWDYYTNWHNQQDESSSGFGGPLSQEYLKRIALRRFGRDWHGQQIIQIQFRARTTAVTGPSWTGAPASATPSYRQLPWWPANDDDYRGLGVA